MLSETDGIRQEEMKKVRVSSAGGLSSESVTTIISERKSKSIESPDAIMSSNILLVDMNGESTPSPIIDNQIPDPSGSPPESPVLNEDDKSETEMKSLSLEAQVGSTRKIVKRLTREVKSINNLEESNLFYCLIFCY